MSLTVPIAQQKLGELWEHSAFVGEVLGGVEHVAPRKTAPLSPPVAETNDDDVSRLLDMVDTAEAPGRRSCSSAGGSSGQGRFDAFLSTIAHSGE